MRIPPLPPAEAGTRFSDHEGMQGWVDLYYVKADRPGIEPPTCQSQVQRPTAAPPRNTPKQLVDCRLFAMLKLFYLDPRVSVRGHCFLLELFYFGIVCLLLILYWLRTFKCSKSYESPYRFITHCFERRDTIMFNIVILWGSILLRNALATRKWHGFVLTI